MQLISASSAFNIGKKSLQRFNKGTVMRIRTIIFLLLSHSVCAMDFNPVWYKMPPGSSHLNPAIFLSTPLFQSLNVVEGTSVLVTRASKKLEMRVYKSLRTGNTFSTNRTNGRLLSLKIGTNKLTILPLSETETSLPFRPPYPIIESYKGDTQFWNRITLSAPHGDGDWFTGEIAKQVSEINHIPTVAAYGCRFPYRGVWFDCNRPLMKPAAGRTGINGIGVLNNREWTPESETLYKSYQKQLNTVANLKSKQRHRLTTSLHGHDLTVRLSNGRVVSKDVIEAVGAGFTLNQLRDIKSFYYKNIKRYFSKYPKIYFGNLPEDECFKVSNVKTYFLYSAAGTRLSGTLRSDVTQRALHFETPNSLRVKKESRKKLAQFLSELFYHLRSAIKDDNKTIHLPNSNSIIKRSKVIVAGSPFLMGSRLPNAWDNEKPQHKVNVSDFSIDKYEVTTSQYTSFLNLAYRDKLIFIDDGIVFDSNHKDHILLKTTQAAPLSYISFKAGKFEFQDLRKNHPVTHVSYYGAKLFANYFGEQLPTEAQWEKAASWNPSTNKKSKYATSSNQVLGKANIEDSKDPFENLAAKTTPVGYFKFPSYYGAYDMSGNVWEWTSDFYDEDIYSKRSQEMHTNPIGAQKGTMKTIRGGSWDFEYNASRTTMRLSVHPNFTSASIGFRCVTR